VVGLGQRRLRSVTFEEGPDTTNLLVERESDRGIGVSSHRLRTQGGFMRAIGG
jgi:hypothetical protein